MKNVKQILLISLICISGFSACEKPAEDPTPNIKTAPTPVPTPFPPSTPGTGPCANNPNVKAVLDQTDEQLSRNPVRPATYKFGSSGGGNGGAYWETTAGTCKILANGFHNPGIYRVIDSRVTSSNAYYYPTITGGLSSFRYSLANCWCNL